MVCRLEGLNDGLGTSVKQPRGSPVPAAFFRVHYAIFEVCVHLHNGL